MEEDGKDGMRSEKKEKVDQDVRIENRKRWGKGRWN